MIKAQTPFLVVNPKSYLYGEKSLELAKAADKVAKETGTKFTLLAHLLIFVISKKTQKI